MSGQILGDRYEVERQIGKQTGRWTLLARDLISDEQVVLKLLFLDEQLEADDLKLFEREVEILKSLSHPSIPRYLGYFEHQLPNDKALVLIQTYVEGKSLEQCLQQRRTFTEVETKQLARALLNILMYLHGRQPAILHRDIKPSNILLANRRAYLVDFGSVKTIRGKEETSSFTVVGTYGYMPPEQFSGRVLPASDLFSLGATLITLIAGNHPSSLPHRGTRIDFSQLPNLSPEYADWLAWLTEPNLEHRVKSAQEALQALEQGRPTIPSPVEKPPDTKISLIKDANSLEVLIPALLGHTNLKIDRQQISLSSKRLGFQSNVQAAPRHRISRLEYRKFPEGSFPDNNESQIVIWAGTESYDLGNNLSPPELDWLAYELSTWLKLPIS
ncbi:serine/threonine protein kinase [Kovacikia minuta CCNUW1]|uniref:serine/threonine protein kinase n=1 Tax=Kovacikia minuta TaxID=2931930 RepID=UPI001CCFD48C|nr:serine/threonine-protein kinase [Kovacikia minuta]UBF25330.1 serine/threonine protein kinase [Kovacikia minuta CCNUW1]